MKFAGFCQFRNKMNDPNEEVKENMKIFLYELFGFAILLWKKIKRNTQFLRSRNAMSKTTQ